VDDGAEVVLIGHRSSQWYSGANNPPPVLVSTQIKHNKISGPIAEILRGVELQQEVDHDEIVTLFSARGAEVNAVAQLADDLRAQAVGDVVTWVHNRNINYTNVCTFKCKFCGFSKGPLSLNLRGLALQK
jgi:FO synthase